MTKFTIINRSKLTDAQAMVAILEVVRMPDRNANTLQTMEVSGIPVVICSVLNKRSERFVIQDDYSQIK